MERTDRQLKRLLHDHTFYIIISYICYTLSSIELTLDIFNERYG